MSLPAVVRSAVRAVATRPLGTMVAVDTAAPVCCLSFDDGPEPDQTPKILDVLDGHGAGAVFFVLLTRARRNPGLVTEILARGHDVGLHGVDHRRLTAMPPHRAAAHVRAGRDELAALLGAPVRFFRPPHGAQNPLTWAAVRRLGLTTVLWNGTLWDWKDVSDTVRFDKAMSGLGPGSILLGHDGMADATDGSDTPVTITVDKPALVDRVLTGAAERGLRAVALRDLLTHGEPVRRLTFSR